MNVFNPAQFRAQFPALQDAVVYLDSAATALKPEAVVEATYVLQPERRKRPSQPVCRSPTPDRAL
ncbi:hypothetical protein ACNKHR_19140 [Shigella flexneri]